MSGLDEENNDPAIQSSHTSTSLKSLSFGGQTIPMHHFLKHMRQGTPISG